MNLLLNLWPLWTAKRVHVEDCTAHAISTLGLLLQQAGAVDAVFGPLREMLVAVRSMAVEMPLPEGMNG